MRERRREKERNYLDDELELTTVIVERDGGVVAYDVFTVYFSRNGDVLADGETENVVLTRQFELVTGGCIRKRK